MDLQCWRGTIFLSNYYIKLNLIRNYSKNSCSKQNYKKILYFPFVENELKLHRY